MRMTDKIYFGGTGGQATAAIALALVVGGGGGSGCGDSEAGSGTSAATDTQTTGTSGDATTMGTTGSESQTGTDSSISGTDSMGGSTDTAGDPLVFDCLDPAKGAVSAPYSHATAASGGTAPYTFSAQGLPPGLDMHQFTGKISGVPELAGTYDVEVTVQDQDDQVDVQTCVIDIGEALAVDLEGLSPCITGGDSILNYLSGGDGSPITCAVPPGLGNGKLPDGLAVDEDSCAIQGTIAEIEYGTWAWIVAATQSKVTVYAPYCASQTLQAPFAYDISGAHKGGDHLDPATATFKPGADLRFDGEADPVFWIDGACGSPCYYRSHVSYTATPFGTGACSGDADGCFGLCPLVPDMNEPDGDKAVACSLLPMAAGFEHELWAKGAPPPDALLSRPWVTVFETHYCMGNTEEFCGATLDDYKQNGKSSNLVFSLVMFPE